MFLSHRAEIDRLAAGYGLEPATLMAIIQVESNGVLFGWNNEPLIRWEGHYFDRMISADKRALARSLGLASPKMGGIKNPRSQKARYAILVRAMKLDQVAAISSISIGVGQVMGSHWEHLGYKSPQEMLQRARAGFEGQVELMLRYIQKNGLIDELQRFDWAGFARGYNGPAYKKFAYDTKMAKAYAQFAGKKSPVSKANGMLRMGVTGKQVRELQQLLCRAGHTVKMDADYGPSTRDAVKAFQAEVGIESDGVAGPETMRALAAFRVAPDEELGVVHAVDLPEVKEGIASTLGSGGAMIAVNEAADKISWMAGDSVVFNMIASGLVTLGVVIMIGGIVWAGYGWLKARRTNGVTA